MSHSILLFLFAFVKNKKNILFVMTLLANITEKCKYERSINIINLFFLNLCGVLENLNSVREIKPLTKSIHVT